MFFKVNNQVKIEYIFSILKYFFPQSLQERDKQIRKQHEEHKRFQVQLDEKATELEELMEKLERQNERKEQLKQRLEEKEVELDDMRRAHR